MIFGAIPLAEAIGAILAHGVRLPASQGLPGRALKKGRVLSQEDVAALQAAGLRSVIAARIEAGDVPEDEVADRVGEACLGPGITRTRAATGRVNLVAEHPGLLVLDTARIDRLNQVDEAVTLATLPNWSVVGTKEMLATVKVIPFAAEARVVSVAASVARGAGPLARVEKFRPLVAGLVLTHLPGLKDSVIEGTIEVTRARVEALGGTLLVPEITAHDEAAVARALGQLRAAGAEVLLVAGASAVVDRRDVCPAALIAAGGSITHFGMPVDPGNLICLGEVAGTPAVILPGCARSPKLNGFDWVLHRIYAGVPISPRDVMAMGVGGLLKEIEARPLPRAKAAAEPAARPARRGPRIAAIVLAAGRSRRMAPLNKLLVPDAHGKAMVARVVDNVLASRARPVIVVTGHEAARVQDALAGRAVSLAHNPDYMDGLSSSLRAGLGSLPDDVAGAIIALGDMPLVSGAILDRLIAAFDPEEGRAIVLPTYRGKQGNPMLWARKFFPAMAAVTGDVGARHLLGEHAEFVHEVEIGDDAVLRDFDTVAALEAWPERGVV
jgi:molybdenum cofactor cytidylyltransferase